MVGDDDEDDYNHGNLCYYDDVDHMYSSDEDILMGSNSKPLKLKRNASSKTLGRAMMAVDKEETSKVNHINLIKRKKHSENNLCIK